MPFSLSGTTITQSGIDVDLSGLSSITGVSTQAAGSGRTVYLMGSLQIVINGTLTHNPDTEELNFNNVSGAPITIGANGTYNLGHEYTRNAVTTYATGTAIVDVRALGGTNGFNGGYRDGAAVRVNSASATFTWKGGQIITPYTFSAIDGTLDIYAGTLFCDYNSSSTNPPAIWIEGGADTVNIRNLRVYSNDQARGVNWQFSRAPDIFSGVQHFFGWGIGSGGTTLTTNGRATEILIEDYATSGEDQTASFWRQNYAHLVGFERGSDIVAGGMLPASHNENRGIIECSKKVAFTVLDAVGAPLEGVKINCLDTDNNNRHADWRGLSWSADRQYTFETDSSGKTATQQVLLAAFVRQSGAGSPSGIGDSGTNADYRGINGDASDVFAFRLAHYEKLLAQTNPALKGTGVLDVSWTLFTDTLVTESNASTVAAYTDLNTSAKLYDAAKLYLVDNYAGETATILTRQGELIDLGALDLVVDATASVPFAFDGATVTIKATTFVGDLVTTGTVTLSNGASLSGALEDASGVRVTVDVGGGAFNIQAMRSDTMAFLGFQDGVTSATYILPRGVTLSYAVWCLGCLTAYDEYDTSNGGAVITARPISLDGIVDTTLDVSNALSGVTLGLNIVSGLYDVNFSNALEADIEQTKAVIHRLLGRDTSLRAVIFGEGVQSVAVRSDEIEIIRPNVKMNRALSLDKTNEVVINTFFNTQKAKQIDPTYILNPLNADGFKVITLPVKPVSDPVQIALAVQALIGGDINQARDHARAANIQTQSV